MFLKTLNEDVEEVLASDMPVMCLTWGMIHHRSVRATY